MTQVAIDSPPMQFVLTANTGIIKLIFDVAKFTYHNQCKQTSLSLIQLQPQQNELKLKTQNAQNREKSLKFSHQIINPVAEACRKTFLGHRIKRPKPELNRFKDELFQIGIIGYR